MIAPSTVDGVSAGCHINDVMNQPVGDMTGGGVSAGCHINDVMNLDLEAYEIVMSFSWMSYQ